MHTHRYTHTYVHACMHAYIHTHIHAYTHTRIYAHTYIHTCIHPTPCFNVPVSAKKRFPPAPGVDGFETPSPSVQCWWYGDGVRCCLRKKIPFLRGCSCTAISSTLKRRGRGQKTSEQRGDKRNLFSQTPESKNNIVFNEPGDAVTQRVCMPCFCLRACMHARMHVCMYACTCACKYACTHVHCGVRMNVHVCLCACILFCTHVCIIAKPLSLKN